MHILVDYEQIRINFELNEFMRNINEKHIYKWT